MSSAADDEAGWSTCSSDDDDDEKGSIFVPAKAGESSGQPAMHAKGGSKLYDGRWSSDGIQEWTDYMCERTSPHPYALLIWRGFKRLDPSSQKMSAAMFQKSLLKHTEKLHDECYKMMKMHHMAGIAPAAHPAGEYLHEALNLMNEEGVDGEKKSDDDNEKPNSDNGKDTPEEDVERARLAELLAKMNAGAEGGDVDGDGWEDCSSDDEEESEGSIQVKTLPKDKLVPKKKEKVKPNSPCPCGSGKKAKKCCHAGGL
jgi:hypothetical protein